MKENTIEKTDNYNTNVSKNPPNGEKSWTEFLTDTTPNMGATERVISAVSGGAMIAYGIRRKDWLGALVGLLGGAFTVRAATGHCQLYDALDFDTTERSLISRGREKAKSWLETETEVVKAVTINKSAEELYNYWRNFENLPQFMNHLESVKVLDEKRSHWTAKAPLGRQVSWDAVISEDVKNEKIAWTSFGDSEIKNSGKVEFKETKNRGTEVKVTIHYQPPAGKIGELATWLFKEEPDTQVAEDLRRFKKLMETGMIIQVEGQTSGRAEKTQGKARTAGA